MGKYNEKIMKKLELKLGIKDTSIIKKIERKKKSILSNYKLGIPAEIIFLLIALENEVDIDNYEKNKEIIQEVYDWQHKIERKENILQVKSDLPNSVKVKTKRNAKTKSITTLDLLDEGYKISIENNTFNVSYIPKTVINEINAMNKVYTWVYLFENSVRSLIIKIMSKYDKNWWNTEKVPKKIRKKIEDRKKCEKKNQWHRGKRNTHPIYYTDLKHLGTIMKNNWKDFEEIFPIADFIGALFNSIELSRNIIAHNNPLPKVERDDLVKDINRWFRQIDGKI